MFQQKKGLGRVVWLPVLVAALLAAVWLTSGRGYTSVRADEPQRIYVSSSSGVSINGATVADEDILVLDTATGQWDLFFDGSELGLAAQDIDALEVLTNGSLLLSLDKDTTAVPGISSVNDSDILLFEPDVSGDYSSGTFSIYVHGEDVGLSTNGEDVDALAVAPNGDLLISTIGTAKVPAAGGGTLTAADEDLLRLTLTQPGENTVGSWAPYFDGSDVKLTTGSEDISGAWVDSASGNLFLSTLNKFNVTGLSGTRSDIFVCQSFSAGNNTSCTFGPDLFWEGANYGFGSELLDALAISGDVSVPPPVPTATPVTPTVPPPGSTATPQPPGSTQGELLVYDWNRPVVESDKGFPRDTPPMASANGDWTKPTNYAEGTLYFRVQIFNMPQNKKMQTQFCVWQDKHNREQCADRYKFTVTPGIVITWSDKITDLWSKPGRPLIDWSEPRYRWGFVIRNEAGKPVAPMFNWSGEDPKEWYP